MTIKEFLKNKLFIRKYLITTLIVNRNLELETKRYKAYLDKRAYPCQTWENVLMGDKLIIKHYKRM